MQKIDDYGQAAPDGDPHARAPSHAVSLTGSAGSSCEGESGAPTLLLLREAAAILRTTPKRVRTLIQLGKLRETRLGPRLTRIDLRDLEEFIRRSRDRKNNR